MPIEPREDEQRTRAGTACRRAGLTCGQVWFRYFGNGGKAGSFEVDAYFNGSLSLPPAERDLIAHAINELIDELPPLPRAPYSQRLQDRRARQPRVTDTPDPPTD